MGGVEAMNQSRIRVSEDVKAWIKENIVTKRKHPYIVIDSFRKAVRQLVRERFDSEEKAEKAIKEAYERQQDNNHDTKPQ